MTLLALLTCYIIQYPATKYVQMAHTIRLHLHTQMDPILIYNLAIPTDDWFVCYFFRCCKIPEKKDVKGKDFNENLLID